MKISLRLSKKNSKPIQKISNKIFSPTIPRKVTMLPFPPFLKDARCSCGKNASFMLDDLTYICCGCINEKLKDTNKFDGRDDISFLLTRKTISNLKFEWSVNQYQWYTIYGRGFRPNNWEDFLHKIKDMILKDKVIFLEVEYKKETKEMIVY